jgi:hypothetical protein
MGRRDGVLERAIGTVGRPGKGVTILANGQDRERMSTEHPDRNPLIIYVPAPERRHGG